MNPIKKSFLTSLISLVLCLTMFLGTTFAWFTDIVVSGGNIIQSGKLDAEMYWSDEYLASTDRGWTQVKDNKPIFTYDNWEPGYTEIKYIKVANAGNLNFKWKLSIEAEGKVTDLSDVIDVYYVNPVNGELTKQALAARTPDGKLTDVLANKTATEGDQLTPGGSVVLAIAFHMDELAGNEYQEKSLCDKGFSLKLLATQATGENDSFDDQYDKESEWPEIPSAGNNASADVPTDANGVVTTETTITGNGMSATVPAGTQLTQGTNKLTLSVNNVEDSKANVTLAEGEELRALDVHIYGVAEGNTTPIAVTLTEALPKGLNIGNYTLHHVEDGQTVAMTLLADGATPVHNDFTYDPVTGDVTLYMASFSEVDLIAEPAKWEGNRDYSWYTNAVAPVDGEAVTEYIIANADQLAAFSAIVGGMDGQTQDSFSGKTVKLIADINLGDGEEANNPDVIFYPIGYHSSDEKYEKTGVAVTTGFYNFCGTFDGNGNTIANFYQNTWEMKGDNNYYDATLQYYRDGMGLFGRVYGGTVKNLTVRNFKSDGEYTTTGTIAAYADGGTFENIAIFNCNPRVYNIGNGGIVGCVGWYAKDADLKTTFKNITVDNSNKISALWGSYDVACGGIVGQYYPTSGQTSAGTPPNGGIDFVNCHVSAIMDVYNDVCANYQYYAYRYAGMLIGSVRENLPADANGHIYPDMTGIAATGCTVHYDTWNDYYYCEIVANSLASYTHDHQFSRLTQVEKINTTTKEYLPLGKEDKAENWLDIPSGWAHYVVVNGEHASENATCYHFNNGNVHKHKDAGTEMINGVEVLKEDKQHIYLPFKQLFTGYGWGVTSRWLDAFDGVGVTERDSTENVDKFEKNDALTGDFLYRVGNGNAFPIGKLFQAIDEELIVDSGVHVSVRSLVDGVTMIGTFKSNKDDWTQSTLHITGGTGPVELTVQDYNNCKEYALIVEVVEAKNVTTYSEMGSTSCVMLNDITMTSNGKYSLYDYQTLYGNGFTFNVVNGRDHDTAGGYISSNGTVWVRNSTLDNVVIVGENYTKYGGTATSEYNFPTVLLMGESMIANSYVSNGSAAVRVGSGASVEIVNTTLEGGIFANLDIRGGKVKLKNVTTINQTNADGTSANKDGSSVGLGIVVYTGSTVAIDIDGLAQYNCISKNATFSASEANMLKNTIFSNNYKDYQFSYSDTTWVNTGILSMVAEVNGDNFTKIAGYVGKDASISSYKGYVYAPQGLDSVSTPGEYAGQGQYHIVPKYEPDYTTKNNVPQVSGDNNYCVYDEATNRYLVSFDDGESFTWDANIISVTKGGNSLEYTVSVSGGAKINDNNTITFDTAGYYTVTYSYLDEVNYRLNNGVIETYSVKYEKSVYITVFEVVDTSAKTEFAFGNNGFRTETANGLTYVMPDVYATVNSNTNGIRKVTIDGKDIYYPVVSMHKTGTSSWYNCFSVFESITITDLDGTVYGTSSTSLPSGLTVIGGFILDANGGVSTAESTNGTGIFNYSTGKEIKCDTYENITKKSDTSGYGLCYYPDSKFTSSTNSRAEQTIVVKYRYTDSNGTPYYYYVGYWCQKHDKSCVTPDTLVTLANGTQKRIDKVTYNDQLLVWNHYTGKYDIAPASIVMNHGYDEYEIVTLTFDDGTVVNTINGHGFFDANENRYVILSNNNAADYIGHDFVKVDGDGYKTVKLVNYSVKTEYTESWSILTAEHYNCVLEGMLTITPAEVEGSADYLMPFELGEGMKFDDENMQADIEKYGLYTYDDFAEYMTEEQFIALGLSTWKVAVGKGYITWDEILYLISIHIG